MIQQPMKLNMSGSFGGDQMEKHLNLSGSDWTDIGSSLTDLAGSYLSGQNQVKSAQALADAQKAQAAANLQIATINAQAAAQAAALAAGAKPGLSTGAIVGIVGGSLLLVGVIVVVALKK